MRLRLVVKRHELPPVKFLWAPDDENQLVCTVAQFLDQVNRVVPLESDDWGLDDYVVEIGGFECFHFLPLAQIAREDDEVLIRPLATPEIRARTLGGRFQISANGQHLVDGVPFGRAALRQSNRPQVQIPPLKRTRLTEDQGGDGEAQFTEAFDEGRAHHDLATQQLLRLEDDEEFDEDYNTSGDDEPGSSDSASAVYSPENVDSNTGIESTSSGLSESSALSSSSESSSEEDSDIQEGAPDAPTSGGVLLGASSQNLSERASSGGSESSPESSVSSSEPPSEPSSKPSSESLAEGFSGRESFEEPMDLEPSSVRDLTLKKSKWKSRSQRRNERKKASKLRDILIRRGVLSKNSTLKDVEEFKKQRAKERENKDKESGVLKSALGADASKMPEHRQNQSREEIAATNIEERATLAEEDGGKVGEFNGSLSKSKKRTMGKESEQMTRSIDLQNTAAQSQESQRRPTLDLAAGRRFVFGSLGVKSPKSKEEEEAVKHQLASVGQTKKPSLTSEVMVNGEHYAEEDATDLTGVWQDSGLWKENIVLTAVECSGESKDLRTPPFPFRQRWDSLERGTKRKFEELEEDEEVQEAQEDGNGVGEYEDYTDEYRLISARRDGSSNVRLNYDDADDQAAEDQLAREQDRPYTTISSSNSETLNTDDLENLPNMDNKAVEPGIVIAFKKMEASAATGWSPGMSDYYVGKVEDVEQGQAYVRLQDTCSRKRKEPEYDWKGRRLYYGLEADVEEDFIEVDIEEMVDLKLVQPGEPSSINASRND
ncbi:hypothetical protein BDY21DRAFT_373892 [Lineolata rhizophorae]|uniref:DUF7357 domain-containing protein n=1 Tax=Lineolata rhizophorae TaxID=578093 RepID=A0A6A6NT58_9PEZI|nr:hypothetical protein BDY21DRAFT_373892 [Lineolata rhizophorae]